MANWLGELVVREVRSTDTVLDLGCGILQATGRIGAVHLAVDAFPDYLDRIKGEVPTMRGELPGVSASFQDKSFDVVLLLDVLEHLPAEAHEATIAAAERIARKRVIVFSPDGMMKQDAWEAWGMAHNPLQEHKSAVFAEDFRKRGYEIDMRRTSNAQGVKSDAFYAVKRFS